MASSPEMIRSSSADGANSPSPAAVGKRSTRRSLARRSSAVFGRPAACLPSRKRFLPNGFAGSMLAAAAAASTRELRPGAVTDPVDRRGHASRRAMPSTRLPGDARRRALVPRHRRARRRRDRGTLRRSRGDDRQRPSRLREHSHRPAVQQGAMLGGYPRPRCDERSGRRLRVPAAAPCEIGGRCRATRATGAARAPARGSTRARRTGSET